MGLHDKTAPDHRIRGFRKQQFAEKPLLGAAKADHRGVLQAAQVERVAIKGQDRELAGLRVELLTVPIDHDDARTRGRVDKGGALGEDRHRFRRVAVVVDQQPDRVAVGVAVADVQRQLIGNVGEGAFLDQARNKPVADFELEVLEGAARHRQQVERKAHQDRKRDTRQHQHRPRQCHWPQPRRPHHHQFALACQTVEGQQHRDKHPDRQDDIEKAGQNQEREVEENVEGKAAIDDQDDQRQRLRQPYRGRERGGDENHHAKTLSQNVAAERGHRGCDHREPGAEGPVANGRRPPA